MIIEYFLTYGHSPDDYFDQMYLIKGTPEDIERANLNFDSEDDYLSGDDGPKIQKDEVFYTEGDKSL